MNRAQTWHDRLRTGIGMATVVGGLTLTAVMAPQLAHAQDVVQNDEQATSPEEAHPPGQGHNSEFLAAALGITVEELEAASQAAREAAHESDADRSTLLAAELGITVEELAAAQDLAFEAALDQAVEEGKLTEEEAALKQAEHDLADYIDREALLADVLGITVEELQAARGEGVRLPELLEALGLDHETLKQELDAAYEEAVGQAVEENVITAEQAEEILNSEGPQRPGGEPGPRGRDEGRNPGPEAPIGQEEVSQDAAGSEGNASDTGEEAPAENGDAGEPGTPNVEQSRPERGPDGTAGPRAGSPQGRRR